MLFPLKLLAWFLGTAVVAVPVAAVVVFLTAVTGSPGSCEVEGRPIAVSLEAAASFQTKWDRFDAALDAGEDAQVTLTESEVTSRARLWVDEHDAPIGDLLVCFRPGRPSASATVDVPFLPADADVLIEGTILLVGPTALVDVDDVSVGGLPGPLTDLVDRFVEDVIDDQTAEVELDRAYELSVLDGEVVVSGRR